MTKSPAPAASKLTSLLLALCCRAVAAGGIAIPPSVAPVVAAMAEKVVESAVSELTVRVPEAAKAADMIEHVAAAAADLIQDVSGASALAPVLDSIAEVAAAVEDAVAKPAADPAPAPATEQRAPSPVLPPVLEEPKSQDDETKSSPQ